MTKLSKKVTISFMDQPKPVVNEQALIVNKVIEDLNLRKEVGIQRYGVALQPFNGRNALQDAYEEALDLTQYLKQVIIENEKLKDNFNTTVEALKEIFLYEYNIAGARTVADTALKNVGVKP